MTDVPGWREDRLGQLAVLKKGKIVEKTERTAQGSLPVIDISAFEGTPQYHSVDPRGTLCEPTDTLMVWDGERSGLCSTGHQGVLGSTITRIRPKSGVDPGFLSYALKSTFDFIQAQRTGTGVPHAPRDLDQLLTVPYPAHLDEQRRIAHVLDTADAGIRRTEAVIDKLEHVKQGLLHDLLTRGLDEEGRLRPAIHDTPTEYQEYHGTVIPVEWPTSPLGDVLEDTIDYRGKTPPYAEDGIPCISANQVNGGDLRPSDKFVSHETYHAWTTRGFPKPGDPILTTEAPVGEVARYPQEGTYLLTRRVFALQPIASRLRSDFLYWFLLWFGNDGRWRQFFRGSTVPRVLKTDILRLEIPVPDIAEQDRIARQLNTLTERVQVERAALSKHKELKSGLMQDLLTGHVRVPESIEVPTEAPR